MSGVALLELELESGSNTSSFVFTTHQPLYTAAHPSSILSSTISTHRPAQSVQVMLLSSSIARLARPATMKRAVVASASCVGMRSSLLRSTSASSLDIVRQNAVAVGGTTAGPSARGLASSTTQLEV